MASVRWTGHSEPPRDPSHHHQHQAGSNPHQHNTALPPSAQQQLPAAIPTWSNDMLTTAGVAVSELLARGRSGTGVNSYCCKCGSPRADVRLQCCSNAVHARCVYPWPLAHCPSCGKGGADVVIEVALPEPFTRSGVVVQIPEEELSKMRGGRWSEAECKFAEMVMEGFLTGMLPLREGGRLGTFLCNLLQCTSARLSSKLRTGKRNFKYLIGATGNLTPEQVFQYEQQQRQLSQKEELFLHYLSSEEAAVASHSLQLEWRLQFVELSQQLAINVSNLQEWGPLLRIASLSNCLSSSSTGSSSSSSSNMSSSNHISALLPSSSGGEEMMMGGAAAATAAAAADGGMSSSLPSLPRKKRATSSSSYTEDAPESMLQLPPPRRNASSSSLPSSSSSSSPPSPMRNLAPLMVRMAADRRRKFTVQHGVMAATTIEDLLRLLREGPSVECAILARASNGAILFVSAGMQRLLGRDDADLLGSRLIDQIGGGGVVGGGGELVGGGLVHREDTGLLSTAFRQTQRHVTSLIERMGNPQLPIQERDLMLLPVILRLHRGDYSFLPRQLTVFATDDFLLLHAPCPAASEPPLQVPYGGEQQQQQQQQQRLQQQPPIITAASRAKLEQDFRNLALTQHQHTNPPAAPPSLPPPPPPPSPSHVVQPAVLRPANLQYQQLFEGGSSATPPLPPGMLYQPNSSSSSSSNKNPNKTVVMTTGISGSNSISRRSNSSSSSSSSSSNSSGRAASPVTATGMEVDGPGEDGVMHDEGWDDITVPPAPAPAPDAAAPGSVSGSGPSGGGGGGVDSCIMAVREGGTTWADVDGLDWATDEDISQALQALVRAPSPPLENDAAWGGAYDLCYSPPTTFEEAMRAFLQGLPAQCFQCTDVWVPSRDPNTERLSLQFGGGLALRGPLSEWIFYSRNFAFYEGQGMPGRVFRSMVCEYRDDVAILDTTLFLRRDGAEIMGVHASFGVPVVQDEMVFVLVFYSSHASSRHITPEVLEFIRHTVASWRVVFAPPPGHASMMNAGGGPGGPGGAGGAGSFTPRVMPEYLS